MIAQEGVVRASLAQEPLHGLKVQGVEDEVRDLPEADQVPGQSLPALIVVAGLAVPVQAACVGPTGRGRPSPSTPRGRCPP